MPSEEMLPCQALEKSAERLLHGDLQKLFQYGPAHGDEDLKELIETGKNKKYKKIARVKVLMDGLAKVYRILDQAPNVSLLNQFSFLKYEKLKYEYSGCSSVRIANGHVERLIFTENEGGITIKLLKLDDSHYGNKK